MNLLEWTPRFFRSQHFKKAWRRSGAAEHGNLAVLFALLCFASNKSLEDSLAACWSCRCALCSQSKWWYEENSLCQVRIWEAFALISSPGFSFLITNTSIFYTSHLHLLKDYFCTAEKRGLVIFSTTSREFLATWALTTHNYRAKCKRPFHLQISRNESPSCKDPQRKHTYPTVVAATYAATLMT